MRRTVLPMTIGPMTIAALTVALLAGQPARASQPFVNDAAPDVPQSVKDGRKWEEGSARLPAWPTDAQLVEIKLDQPHPQLRYFIDAASLTTGDDGVVRYTLVATASTGSGARNVSFEGLRCTPKGRFKVYAYGDGKGFQPTAIAEEWQSIPDRGGDGVHRELWRHYLCVPRLFKPRTTRDQLRMLRSGRVPAHDNTGFIAN